MDDPKDIDEVLLILQRERPVLTKDKKGQVGNQKTRYADLVQVNAVVLGRLNELDTIWVCRPHIEEGAFGLHYQLRHVPSATEKAGVWPLKLSENPQQMGSATSYGRRYALLAVTGIVSDEEDDDGEAASGARVAQRAAAPRPAQATAARARPPLPKEADVMLTEVQSKKVHATLRDLGKGNREAGLAEISRILGRTVTSTKELTKVDAGIVIDNLDAQLLARSEPEIDDWPPVDQSGEGAA
jgi:hypothetical protein